MPPSPIKLPSDLAQELGLSAEGDSATITVQSVEGDTVTVTSSGEEEDLGDVVPEGDEEEGDTGGATPPGLKGALAVKGPRGFAAATKTTKAPPIYGP